MKRFCVECYSYAKESIHKNIANALYIKPRVRGLVGINNRVLELRDDVVHNQRCLIEPGGFQGEASPVLADLKADVLPPIIV